MNTETKLNLILKQFGISAGLFSYTRIDSGHINETWKIETSCGKTLILQKINSYVFSDPAAIMRNIELISEHLRAKSEISVPEYNKTVDGTNFLIFRGDSNISKYNSVSVTENTEEYFIETTAGVTPGSSPEYWRLCNFIDGVTFTGASGNDALLRSTGRGFGSFVAALSDFDASLLSETIPRFHDTPYRLDCLFQHSSEDPLGRVKDIWAELEFVSEYRGFASELSRMQQRGELPLRVTHNDTKTSNIIFDRETLEPIAVIDLDTCMPGLIAYDFGDSVRSVGCRKEIVKRKQSGSENDDFSCTETFFDINAFRSFTESYLAACGHILTEQELDSLPLGALTITLELVVRYLDDYITGDKYFRTSYPAQNLEKGRTQLKLFLDMYSKINKMHDIINSYSH